MIKSLAKALEILEFVAAEPDRPRPLGEISRRFALHQATCMNLVRTLAACGYLEQETPRGGYRAGPMVFCLAGGRHYRPALRAAARPLLEQLTAATGETTLLVTFSGDRRFIVLRVDGNQDIQVHEALIKREIDSVYRTATGRVLLAWQPAAERRRFLENHQAPDRADWPEAGKPGGAEAALARIRQDGGLVMPCGEVVYVAVPVLAAAGNILAALGMPLPRFRLDRARQDELLAAMKTAAAKITRRHRDSRPGRPARAGAHPGPATPAAKEPS